MAATVMLVAAGCASASSAPSASAAVVRVPADAPTISAAVTAVREGGLVLVSPGVYRESVLIRTPKVTLRGTDRNDVVIDGEVRRANGVVVTAPGVTVQNLTVRDHTLNGVLVTGMSDEAGGLARGSTGYTRLDTAKFPPLNGFHVSHVTASNNALYGIYAFNSRNGVIEQSYASGSADSGIYVGQCKPCNIVVRGNVAERNAVGYEGTNASGEMYVLGNRLVGNRVGLTSNSDYQEALVPQQEATIMGNLVGHNAESASPAQADGGFGLGIGISGGIRNQIVHNRVVGNPTAGLVLSSSEDLPPIGNTISGNVMEDNGFDLVYAASARAPGSANCVRENQLATIRPGPAECFSGAGAPMPRMAAPRGIAFRAVARPPRQPNMTEPPVPGTGPGDLGGYGVPPLDLLADRAGVRP
ncbi:right-handed parallel beta-helix repeat-containing protein [Allokutzneria oryzae]|uniref:Nitrous oxide reductase family maturation protein NosD n=1 Tax=Allokutzneria oryzae TaxID=1378989 RepID=A0ABV6A6B8_9PSEU